ncbi:PTS ascorbate transporter subunit IIB [Orenia metallireducens]|uniref:PTS ascorbate transporter subunit IIB n=1 Tax=Orenia metallireducens TaxID=1413210 RepID=A0A1C0A5H4_9FIRM|nr:PTS sugar transporter subunit IIB [Orenia metallireducens]OCL25400.1 PTS ascorbate transporter subunit IIB [Orenia metallireducens]
MRILAVCGMGLGSSLMLRMGVEKVLKAEGIEGTVEVSDVSSAKGEKADIIVAAPEIAEQLEGHSARVIAIKNMADKNEIKEKIMDYIS